MTARIDAATRCLLGWCPCPRCDRRTKRAKKLERDRLLKRRRSHKRDGGPEHRETEIKRDGNRLARRTWAKIGGCGCCGYKADRVTRIHRDRRLVLVYSA